MTRVIEGARRTEQATEEAMPRPGKHARTRRRWANQALAIAAAAAICVLLLPPSLAEIRKWNPDTLFDSRDFSHVVVSDQVSKIVYLSGIGPLRPGETALDVRTVKEQTRRVLANVVAALAAAGATTDDVVRIHIYVVDYQMMEGMIISRQIRKHFQSPMPASSFIPVSGLLWDGALVQMDVVANVGVQ